jgi:hypothetical protein
MSQPVSPTSGFPDHREMLPAPEKTGRGQEDTRDLCRVNLRLMGKGLQSGQIREWFRERSEN